VNEENLTKGSCGNLTSSNAKISQENERIMPIKWALK